jgi:hypothetical protein
MVAHTLFNWHQLGLITGPTLLKLKWLGRTDSTRIHNELIDEIVLAKLAQVDGDGDFTNSPDIDIVF